MNRSRRFVSVVILAMTISLPFCSVARAAGPNDAEVQGLRQAYVYLAAANHDYKGHRIKARKSVEKACDLLGFKIKGDGRAREQQGSSDDLLRAAQAQLKQVRPTAAAQNQTEVVSEIDRALKEISTALSIK
jgi:hypothetical protein